MSKAAPSPRWFAGWRAERQPEVDAADLGTAWGLDLSLIDSALEPGAPTTPAASTASTTPRRRGWAQRLGLQRKPAA